MRFDPYKRPPPDQPIGLVTRTRRVLTEDGGSVLLRNAPAGLVLYADAHVVNERFLRRGDGRCLAWNDRPIRWLPDLERSVILLQGFPGDDAAVLEGLIGWRDAIHARGARIGSPAAASSSLLRATLDRPLYLGSDRPRLSQVLGGRQEAFVEPGVYGSFVHVDIRAAYARTLGRLTYPYVGGWRSLGAAIPSDPELPVLVRAVVNVPPMRAGPLPRRPARRPPPGMARFLQRIEYPTGGRVQGTWTLAEIRAAIAAGAHVRPIECWMMLGAPARPFAAWLDEIEAGRKLPGYAGDLFKVCGNTLWGRFALDGIKTEDRYADGRLVSRRVAGAPINPLYGAEDVAELVASSVRARLFGELIAPHAERLLSVHTDGGLIAGTTAPALPADWRVKDRGRLITYIGPQMYAYVPAGARTLEYVCSGLEPSATPAAFAGVCRSVLGWPPTTFGDSVAARERRSLDRLVAAFPDFAEQLA